MSAEPPGPPGHRDAAAQVFVTDLADPTMGSDDLHHLGRVLRLRSGSTVCAADGLGSWRPCSFTGGDRLEPIGDTTDTVAPAPSLGVGFAPVKGDRPELVVQKLTELGVDRILVFEAARSVVRWEGDRAGRHMDRLRRITREASQQCRRLWLPTVERTTLAELRRGGAVLADATGRPPHRDDHLVLVGPEGGWNEEERIGATTVALGEHVLRSETAAIAAGVVITALRAGLLTSDLPHSN